MRITDTFHSSWHPIINLLYQEPLKTLNEKILPEISYQPDMGNIFRIFSMPITDIKVVLLGQDPYPTPGNALGRAFAVSEQALEHWEKEGVFLLNSALTVETGKAGSHLKYWKDFTQRVVSLISTVNPCIWILWGKKVQQYKLYIKSNPFHISGYNKETINEIPINSDWNYILQAHYYSGSRSGFFGGKHFLFANRVLKKTKYKEIAW